MDPQWDEMMLAVRQAAEPWDRNVALLTDMGRVLSPQQQTELEAYRADLNVVREETAAARAQANAVDRLRRVTLDVPLSNEQRDELMGIYLENPGAGDEELAKVLTPQQMAQFHQAGEAREARRKQR
ncbi:MAG: hypothetical protein HC901_02315 [Bdellovibrionaceae bacterium]|nr:hypothetical protein [Pseudobdellovibrionaceae bacterium]